MSGTSSPTPPHRREKPAAPTGDVFLRTLCLASDLNSVGTMFGGWIMAQLDIAATLAGNERARGRVMTAGVNDLRLLRPLLPGHEIQIYCHPVHVGRTSMQFQTELWARQPGDETLEYCAHAVFVMVAIDRDGKPRAVPVG